MLSETGLRMMRLAGKGYCCSQIMLLLALEDMDRNNPDMVRALAGLCQGLGDCSGPCGVLTGGVCMISLYAAKGRDDEEALDGLPLMLESFRDWFTETVGNQFGGIHCRDILGDECGSPDPERCGGLMASAYDRIQEIFMEQGIDPAMGRDD